MFIPLSENMLHPRQISRIKVTSLNESQAEGRVELLEREARPQR